MAAHPRPVTYRISAQLSGTGGLVADVYQTFPRPFLTAHLDDGVMENVVTNWGNDGIGIEMAGPGLAGNWLPGLGPMQFLPIGPLFIRDANNLLSIDFSGLQSQIDATNTALAANSAADAIWQARLVTDESQISANTGALVAQQADIVALQSALSVADAQILNLQQQIAALTTRLYPTAEALFAGVGGLLASRANLRMLSSAQFAGTGTLEAQLGLVTTLTPYQFAGSGGMAVALSPVLAAQATLQGSGSMAAELVGILPIATSLAGSGNLAAALVTNFSLSAALVGSGGFSATLFRPIYLDAITLAGAGGLTASLGNLMALSGISGPGSGGLSVASLNSILAAQANLAGTGAAAAALFGLSPLSAALAGAGSLTATPQQNLQISALTGPNMAVNPTASGAVVGTPGTVPTGWQRNTSGGMTGSILNLGIDPATGVNYVDFNFVGTPLQTNSNVIFGALTGVNAIPAAPGQRWLGSIFFTALQDDPAVVNYECLIYALDGTGAILQFNNLLMSHTAPFTQYFNSLANFPAGTVATAIRFVVTWTQGNPVNVTVRLGAPWLANVPLGTGSLTANLTQVVAAKPIQASLSGTGLAFINSLTGILQTNAVLTGSGGLAAALSQLLPVNAQLAGSGGLTAVAQQVWPLSTSLTGSGGFTAAAPQQLMRIGGNILGPQMLPNPTANGAVVGTPGTLPTNWVKSGGGGLTISVLNTGTDPATGIPYVDLGWTGTTTTASQVTNFCAVAGVGPAAPGQSWQGSIYYQLLQDDPNIINHDLIILPLTSAGTALTQSAFILPRTGVGLSTFAQYTFINGNAFAAGTAFVILRYLTNWTTGATVNFSTRLGFPSLVQVNPAGSGGMTANITGGH